MLKNEHDRHVRLTSTKLIEQQNRLAGVHGVTMSAEAASGHKAGHNGLNAPEGQKKKPAVTYSRSRLY